MEKGYYWLYLEREDPCIVSVDDDNNVYFTGSDYPYEIKKSSLVGLGQRLKIISFQGPIQPPLLKQDNTKKPVFKFTLNGKHKELTLLNEDAIVVSLSHDVIKNIAGIPEMFECSVEFSLDGESGVLYPGDYKHFHLTDQPKITVTKTK